MINANLVKRETVQGSPASKNQSVVYTFTIPNVAGTAISSVYGLSIGSHAFIENMKVTSLSDDFDIVLKNRDIEGIVEKDYTIDIINCTGFINSSLNKNSINANSEQYLYCVINNKSAIATGNITINLTVAQL